ncbi:hypothetical protein WPS_16560 [Vulcanimicrobium alpinum]|uniref:histidine kinase n=1 Tax=Vulcanimicrobium alpinum TaxID=3016050 RepID=A0AAN1XVV4_UNVUL|nr:HAMP domain-containing sensor histidine kinase [Vulcanimicrobium alpinum]BDE06380.1 hypothetical protein WPS_16560 [Vulcanimicrobium alpinum]
MRAEKTRPAPSDALARRIAAAPSAVPLLALRLPALERVAWRRGRRAARALERRAVAAFSRAAREVLRAGDLLAHDDGSDVFLAALVAPTRDGGAAAPVDARSALARIAAALESETRLDVLTGWSVADPARAAGSLDDVVDEAMLRGARERERYAFFSALGHELRTPLSSIRGYLETLLDERDVDAETRQRFVRTAYDESLRMTRLLEGMFEISLLDLRAGPAERACASLRQALTTAREACAANAAVSEVSIHLAAAPAVDVAIDGDRLTLVLINLIDNAVKHGRRGGRVVVGVDLDEPRFVRVNVDDDGAGIAALDRERVFALGERATTAPNGTGLGLAIVRLILERSGGRVELTHSPLGGARFIVSVARA